MDEAALLALAQRVLLAEQSERRTAHDLAIGQEPAVVVSDRRPALAFRLRGRRRVRGRGDVIDGQRQLGGPRQVAVFEREGHRQVPSAPASSVHVAIERDA